MKFIVGIVHPIYAENGLQATFVERLVVRHEWQAFYEWGYTFPDLREYRGAVCVLETQAMHLAAPVIVILRLRPDEGIERTDYLSTSHYYYANGADG